MQMTWNGMPLFIRRLTQAEVKHEAELPKNTLLDPLKEVVTQEAGSTTIVVTSAVCTHLGCIPIPYLGAYNGWVCICHGSVYDKYGRVRQGPALENLPMINNTIYENGNNRSDARVFADWFMFNGTAKLVCGLFAKRSQASACDGSAC